MSETLTDPLLGRLIDGRYEVRSRVAAGGMATVYVAFDRRLEREVAIKVMSPHLGQQDDSVRFASRFRREARAAARLTHPGMVRVYDQGVDGEISYLTMEYVEGENLRSRIAHERTLTVGESLAISEQVLDALAAAHRLGLVHRDIKPENVLLDTDGRPRLADFGLSRAIEDATASTTSTGIIMGTAAYLSPELVSHGTADTSTDVYAVGILLFEMLTGRQPFTGESPLEVATQHVHQDVPAPSSHVPWLPAEIDELVQRMTARDPQARPADAAAALAEIRSVLAVLDDPTLDRRADPPSGAVPVEHTSDPDATTVFDSAPAGTTVALPVGLATLEPAAGPEPDVIEAEIVPPSGTDQDDSSRSRPAVWIGAIAAAVTVLALLGVWWYMAIGPGAYSAVPDVSGETAAAATATLEDAGFIVLDPSTEFSDTVEEGLVLGTDPEASARVLNGSEISLTVSAGPRMATVPEIVGEVESNAMGQLGDAGFTTENVTVEREHSDTVSDGTVISIEPGVGEELRHDATLTMTVSDGPAPIEVPNVYGMAESEALDALAVHAMDVTVEYGRTADVDTGEVYQQSLAAGSDSVRTAGITITVSEGLPLVTVPDFIGMNAREAQRTADDLALLVQFSPRFFSFITGDLKNNSEVVDQNVAPNTEIEQGSTIYLIYDN